MLYSFGISFSILLKNKLFFWKNPDWAKLIHILIKHLLKPLFIFVIRLDFINHAYTHIKIIVCKFYIFTSKKMIGSNNILYSSEIVLSFEILLLVQFRFMLRLFARLRFLNFTL